MRFQPIIIPLGVAFSRKINTEDMAMMSARDVARYFVSLVDEDAGDSISNLKLQKLLYYAQGGFLAFHDRPLFSEAIKAWDHGPVVPQVYHDYKECGAASIPVEGVDLSIYPADVREVLDEVNSVYGQFTASKLRSMTHDEPPWRDTPRNETITHEKLKKYFKTLIYDDQVSPTADK